MAAQRSEGWRCDIDAVEIDREAAAQARANFDTSPWAGRLNIYAESIQEFSGRIPHSAPPYGLVVSNPPFFSDSLTSPDQRRALARHTDALSYDDLTRCAAAVLDNDGALAVIVPFDHAPAFIAAGERHGLYLYERLNVKPTPARPPKRSLMAFSRTHHPATTDILTIEDGGRHLYSEEYRRLTGDFYLKF